MCTKLKITNWRDNIYIWKYQMKQYPQTIIVQIFCHIDENGFCNKLILHILPCAHDRSRSNVWITRWEKTKSTGFRKTLGILWHQEKVLVVSLKDGRFSWRVSFWFLDVCLSLLLTCLSRWRGFERWQATFDSGLHLALLFEKRKPAPNPELLEDI